MCKSRAKSADKGHKDIFFNSSFFLYAAFALLVLIHSKPIRRREFRNKRLKPYEGPSSFWEPARSATEQEPRITRPSCA